MMNRNNGTRERENRRKGSKTFYLVNAPSDGIFRVDFRIAHRFTRKRVRISWISFVLLLERSRDSRGEQRGRCHHAECHFWDVCIRCVRCCVCVCVCLFMKTTLMRKASP